MSNRKLVTHVIVRDESGQCRSFGPDDSVPKWAAKQITNSKAWAAVEAEHAAGAATVPADQAVTVSVEAESTSYTAGMAAAILGDAGVAAADVPAAVESVAALSDVATLPIPPKGGPNASGEAWAAYAAQEIAVRSLPLVIPSDAGRNDIIDALKGAGIPTE